MSKNYLMALLLILGAKFLYAQNGTVTGTLLEELNGEQVGLPFANVFLEGTTIGGTSDFNGNFSFTAPAGSYTVVASFMGYETFKQAVEIVAGTDITIKVEMKPEGVAIEGVTVVAKVNRESEVALMLEQKKATVIKESIGAKQLSAMGVSDAAGAATKISGVNKTDDSGDVYIRGLGDRYLMTTMNGLPIPSDDIEKKNIDLNLFPTDIIQNVGISKTYSVDGYADQTSGIVDISSKTFSDKLVVGLSTGANSNVLSNVFGSFRGTQNLNDVTYGFYSQPYKTTDAVQKQSWNTTERKMPLNFGYSLMGGKKIDVLGNDLTLFATLSHSASSEYKTGTYQKYRSNYANEIFEYVEEYKTNINTTGLLNVAYEMPNNSSINFNSMAILKTTDELYESGREGLGYYFEQTNQKYKDSSIFLRDQNIKTTQIFINQLLGTHQIGEKNTLKWAGAYNIVNADEPNRIRNMVTMPEGEPIEFIWVGGADQRKSFQLINDKEFSGYVQDQFRLKDEEDKSLEFNLGTNFRYKKREFESQIIGAQAKRLEVGSIDNLDEVLNDEARYANNEVQILERTPDLYNGRLFVYAGYLNTVWQLAKFSGSIGLRYEVDNINLNWDVISFQGRVGIKENDYKNLLPSINLKYKLSESGALRMAASKSITLPEFKELAPIKYNSPEGRVILGNEKLVMSENYNIDLKYELFPRPKELFSLAAFYKLINDPINMSLVSGSSGYFKFFNTGKQATVYGLELEGKFYIIRATESEKPHLKLSFNATKMWHKQDLKENHQYYNKTESGLEGASDYIVNGSLNFSNNKEKEFVATLTANYSSDKIFALGAPDDYENSDVLFNSEIIEKGFMSLDVVVSKKITKRISAKLYGKNLLNPDIEQTQLIVPLSGANVRTEVVKSYKKGIQVGLSMNINLN